MPITLGKRSLRKKSLNISCFPVKLVTFKAFCPKLPLSELSQSQSERKQQPLPYRTHLV